jgi:prevent-host-death family protein
MREARAHLADLLDDAERGNVTFITRHGRTVAAVAPAALLERVGRALDALPPRMDSAADVVLTDEDGSLVVMEVKAYGRSLGQAEPSEAASRGTAQPWSEAGGALVVMAPPGVGKTELLAQLIAQNLLAGRPLVMLDPAGEYARSDADCEGNPRSAGETLPQPSEARTR